MMTLLQRREISRTTTRGPRTVGSNGRARAQAFHDLTRLFKNVTINPIEGDQEFMKEIQPHLNTGLWPVYLAQAERELKPIEPPTDGREEAPGAHPQPPAKILR